MTPLKKFMELPRTFLMLLARITIKMFQWLHKLTTCFILHHYRLIRLQGDFDQLDSLVLLKNKLLSVLLDYQIHCFDVISTENPRIVATINHRLIRANNLRTPYSFHQNPKPNHKMNRPLRKGTAQMSFFELSLAILHPTVIL